MTDKALAVNGGAFAGWADLPPKSKAAVTVSARSFAKAACGVLSRQAQPLGAEMFRAVMILLLLATSSVSATTIDRIRTAGVLHCGGVPRPGLAFQSKDGGMAGLEVDLCKALAAAVMPAGAASEFHPYVLGPDFERLRRGDDAVAFLTGSELMANNLLDAVVPGPSVFQQTNGVMVATGHPAQHLSDLAGTMVCAEPGTGPERTLLAYFRNLGKAIHYSGWQEEEEMLDAFNVGRCPAVAMELTALAALRADGLAQGKAIRILPEPLSATPILAVTGLDDAQWAAVVGWSVQTLMQPDASALLIPGHGLGLQQDWQTRMAAGGTYDAIVARNLGMSSALQLPPSLNASWRDGGLNNPPGAE